MEQDELSLYYDFDLKLEKIAMKIDLIESCYILFPARRTCTSASRIASLI